jgi:hypothetical protein
VNRLLFDQTTAAQVEENGLDQVIAPCGKANEGPRPISLGASGIILLPFFIMMFFKSSQPRFSIKICTMMGILFFPKVSWILDV